MPPTSTSAPPLSFYGPTPEGFPPLARISVERYERMIDSGAFNDDDRFELIEGTLVQKMTKKTPRSAGTEGSWRALHSVLAGWHVRIEEPVRIPERDSMSEPDVSVARGSHRDYRERDPGPGDLALVVEVAWSNLAADRALARTYGGGNIPAYWIVNVLDRQIEVYANPVDGVYPPPLIIPESGFVDLVIDGQVVAQILAAELLGTD